MKAKRRLYGEVQSPCISKKGNEVLVFFNILETSTMKEAVKFAYQHTHKGSVCLLSCASPSYSLWKNFEEKGDQFKKYIKDLSLR